MEKEELKNTPAISVIITAKDSARYLTEAILSVQKQTADISQEIILVDNGSSDNTMDIAAELGCRVLKNIPPGLPPGARNTGIRAARGRLLLFHDSDDILSPNAIATLYAGMQKDSELQAVFALRKDFISPELTEEERRGLLETGESYSGAMAGCALIKREVFDVTGLFDESLGAGDSMSLQLKLQDAGIKHKLIHEVTVFRRLHAHNFGRSNWTNEHIDYATVLRQLVRPVMKPKKQ